jgi:hypothetical protein
LANETNESEESINDYMARLMERVSGSDTPYHPQSQEQSEPPSPETHPEASPETHPEASPSGPANVPPARPGFREPVELTARAEAPEKHVDMSAMRQLANASAKTAIDKHTQGQMSSNKRSKLLVVVISLLVGGMLMWMGLEFGAAKLTYYAALVSFLVALLWGIEYAIITGKMIVNRSGHLDWQPPDDLPHQSSEDIEAKPEDD